MNISREDFDYVSRLVHAHSGVLLEPGKEYLVEARLQPLVRKEELDSISTLVARLRASAPNGLHQRVIEAMTTNETSFFRDMHPFEALRKSVFPELLERRRSERRLRIWSGACSTGQEPYSLVMLLRENFAELEGWSCEIVATDIATDVLARACAGRYTHHEVSRGLPAPYLVKYFRKQGADWEINEEVRREVQFVAMNLTKQWPLLPKMDVVLMRNVLIYFDLETKKQIFAKLRRQMAPDGYLLLGAAETTLGIDDSFERVSGDKSGWFRLRNA